MRPFPLACLLTLCLAAARAEETPPAQAPAKPEAAKADAATTDGKPTPGHSANGEAFNEGPRQAAVLIEGCGKIDFPVTTTNAEAQKFFTQGVGQLHGFWYFEAERSFRQVAALDAECAMAYWGMAMANINNEKRAADFMKLAVAKKAKASRREQLWIDAYAAYYGGSKSTEDTRRTALVRALEDLSYEFPKDLEAKAFLVFQLWDNKQHRLPLPSRQAVDALAQQVLSVNPMHPVHHYLIHLWNNMDGDKRAIVAAANCGQSAPGIAHMWHMSGHTFSNLRRYQDAAWQQEASARVDHAYMASARIMPEQIHNYAHNNDWLVKNLTYVGRVHDAIDLAKNMIELPRLGPNKSRAYSMGRERLLETLVQFELWNDLLTLEKTMYLEPEKAPDAEARRTCAFAVARFNTGDAKGGAEKLNTLEGMLKTAREQRVAAADAAEAKAIQEKKPEDQVTAAMSAAMRTFAYRITTLEAAIAEVKIYQALAAKKLDGIKPLLEKARDLPVDRKARVYLAIGDAKEAEKLARDAVKPDAAQLLPQASLALILWESRQPQAAREVFERVRALSANLDLDLPIVKRLAPIAEDLKLPADWRTPVKVAADAGVRPDIQTLGPFRWHPYTAPSWSLPDSQGQTKSLADYRGKPVLVVFYLGSVCARCIEQLNVFAPLTKEFADAGIPIVAVSTDSTDGLHKTFEQAKEAQGFPFPILSDVGLEAFKAYRAYDDFEKIPLHGTFLIDGNGSVRWQDISYQPFKDGTWLLGEAKRLLSVPVEEKQSTAAK
jgi:peroxiredoxin